MLVISRKPDEKVYIGNDIVITLVEVRGNRVRLGIEAPYSTPIVRSELREAEQKTQARRPQPVVLARV
jgi:carbon storage regulator